MRKDLGRAYYDENYGDYEARTTRAKLAFYLALVRKWVPEGGRLFEMGVGQGQFLQLAAAHYQAAGCDINSFGVAQTAARVSAADVILGSHEALANRPPLDAVVAWDVLEHLPDLDTALAAVQRSLAPAGKLIGVVPVYDGPLGWLVRRLDKDPTHVFKEGRHWWIDKLASQGFELLECGGILRKLVARSYYLHLTCPQSVLRSTGVAIYFVARRNDS